MRFFVVMLVSGCNVIDVGDVRDVDGGAPVIEGDAALDDAGRGSLGGATPLLDVGTEARSALASERDRLMSCDGWAALADDQRAEFLLITDLLFKSPLADGTSALAHVVSVHGVRGQRTEDCTRCCGDMEFNRIYLSLDATLAAAMRARTLGGWRRSRDIAGPHDPFTQSLETAMRDPRGQAHFFASPADSVALGRIGVEQVVDERALEVDLDFNLVHESGPLCTYGGATGVERYESSRGPAELDYAPAGGGC